MIKAEESFEPALSPFGVGPLSQGKGPRFPKVDINCTPKKRGRSQTQPSDGEKNIGTAGVVPRRARYVICPPPPQDLYGNDTDWNEQEHGNAPITTIPAETQYLVTGMVARAKRSSAKTTPTLKALNNQNHLGRRKVLPQSLPVNSFIVGRLGTVLFVGLTNVQPKIHSA